MTKASTRGDAVKGKHSVLFLGYDEHQTTIIGATRSRGIDVHHSTSFTGSPIETDLVISFGLREIMSPRDIEKCHPPILNIHISYLPYNRGAHPNFWSWYDETPVGVTIHRIDTGLDTGPVVLQRLVNIDDSKTTFRESHQILISEAESLFLDNLDSLIEANWKETPQKVGGTYHKKSELPTGFLGWDRIIKEEIARLKYGEQDVSVAN
jgi:methionyl-tRNA formyltransferase